MRPRTGASVALLALALLASGCGGDTEQLAARYRAEQIAHRAQRAEHELRLGRSRPDSVALLKLRSEYRKIGASLPPPYVRGESERSRTIGRDVLRMVATGELQGARLALEARRPDLALEQARWLTEHSEGDSLVQRQSDFLAVGALRAMGRIDEAVERMRLMLRRYEPKPPPPGTSQEDAILSIPEMMAQTRRAQGDEEGAARELVFAEGYYQGLLTKPRPPMLEALIHARLVRVYLERNEAAAGLAQVTALERLVAANPALKPLEPELRYSRAKIRALTDRDRSEAISMLERFAADYPKHPLAPRALFDAGVYLEDGKRLSQALELYRAIVTLYPTHQELAPVALFRQAMLEEKTGDWDRAKATLESIPVKYPGSQAAAEAPFMIARRFFARGDRDAARGALARAITIYEQLVARDSTSAFAAGYRFNILRSHLSLGHWDKALATVDEMALKNRKHPFTAQALLDGAKVANANKQRDRAAGYLQQFLEDYPNSPVAADVRKEKAELLR